jgi:hypothetical protein
MSLKNITNLLAYAIARKAIIQSAYTTAQNIKQSDKSLLRVVIPVKGNIYKCFYTFQNYPVIKQSIIDMDSGKVEIVATGYPIIISDSDLTYAEHLGQYWAIVTRSEPVGVGGQIQWVKSPFLASPPKGYKCGVKWVFEGAQ